MDKSNRLYPQWLPAAPWVISISLLIVFFVSYDRSANNLTEHFLSPRQLQGTLVLFSLLPAYLLAIWMLQVRGVTTVLGAYAPLVVSDKAAERLAWANHRRRHLHPLVYPLVAIGVIFGAVQNSSFFHAVFTGIPVTAFDCLFASGNCFLWGCVFLLLAWRIPLSYALSQLGRELELDVYGLERLKPAGRMATLDVLLVTGALALMPLQSLDAEIRWANYLPGILVGVPSALLLFVLPLWGLRQNIVATKSERLYWLESQLEQTPRDDWARLETLSAHTQRIRDYLNWPVDFRLVTRIVAYTIIPPLAWVGAALVENVVDRFAS